MSSNNKKNDYLKSNTSTWTSNFGGGSSTSSGPISIADENTSCPANGTIQSPSTTIGSVKMPKPKPQK